jgi:hypothetical protein
VVGSGVPASAPVPEQKVEGHGYDDQEQHA